MGEVNNKKSIIMMLVVFTLVTSTAILSGCIGDDNSMKTKITQTGSSTVLPLAIAWAEEFDGADISVSGGGSSHGLNSLLNGEAELGDASRLMKASDYEKVGCDGNKVKSDGTASEACNGILPTKWIIAYDMLAVVINPDNTWATRLNYSQLYEIFTDDNPAIYWDEVSGLNETAPHAEIEIYAPDEASGTYDYFFEEIIPRWGKDDQQANTRLEMEDTIYHPSADDNVILSAIRDNKNAIGFFGFAYYKENPSAVTPVWISEDDNDYQEPSLENVANYPMARPLHIYTDGVPESDSIINDYLKYVFSDKGQDIVPEVGYVKLNLVDINLITEQISKLE
jgi:phosphate transport system substrate-binding protein